MVANVYVNIVLISHFVTSRLMLFSKFPENDISLNYKFVCVCILKKKNWTV